MKVIDPGYGYQLICIDGNFPMYLQFVKRKGPESPGNTGAYRGTNLQDVFRVCLNRLQYLQKQKWCMENLLIIHILKTALWLLEFRAARRHGFFYLRSFHYASYANMCEVCGHTLCTCSPLEQIK